MLNLFTYRLFYKLIDYYYETDLKCNELII